MTGWVDGDEAWLAMHGDSGGDPIGTGVDHRDGAGLAISDIDLVAQRVYRQADWIRADLKSPVLTQIDEIEDAHSIRAAIADVGELPVAIGNVGKAAAAAASNADQERSGYDWVTKKAVEKRLGHCSESILESI